MEIQTFKTINCNVFSDKFEKVKPTITTSDSKAFLEIGNALTSMLNDENITTIIITKSNKN